MHKYELRRRVAAAFFPNRCPFCGRLIGMSDYYCGFCRKTLPYLYGRIAPPENISELLVCCTYSGAARNAVLSFKYGRLIYPADAFAVMMCEKLRGIRADLLVPVPSSFLSIQKRGFASAKLICSRISERLEIPMAEAVRARDDKKEQKTLSQADRLENAQKNFYLAKNTDVSGKRLILVDDVSTTGSSLATIAGLLRNAGAEDVKAVVFAKSERPVTGKTARLRKIRRIKHEPGR